MRQGTLLVLLAAATAALLVSAVEVAAQGARNCDFLEDGALLDSNQAEDAKRPIPNDLLFSPDAVACFLNALEALGPQIRSPRMDEATLDRVVTLTGGLRSILASRGAPAIEEFRAYDNLRITTVLVFAARSAHTAARVNATLTLADTVDNGSLCVPIDHLYDPELDKSEGGDSGRVNLLGVISVVAPWAYQETFENIARLVEHHRTNYSPRDLPQTFKLLDNIQERLDYQQKLDQPFMERPLPRGERDCAEYTPLFANRDGTNLRY